MNTRLDYFHSHVDKQNLLISMGVLERMYANLSEKDNPHFDLNAMDKVYNMVKHEVARLS